MRFSYAAAAATTLISTVLADVSITSFANSLKLSSSFDPIKAAYWTGLPHHRRTPFSVSPDGTKGYLAYLDSTYSSVVVQEVDLTTFAAVGTAYKTTGYEATGLVAQNDGFALLATVNATGTTDLPTDNEPIVSLIRVKDGAEAWRTPLNGPGVHASAGLTATPDANGDLVYSEASGLYGAYFVVTAYTGDAAGHFGDSIQYVTESTGALTQETGSSTFGCSHNTGIGIESSDAPPFATVCAEDQGDIWLNTDTQYMSGRKIANENTTNGVSGEPMGGMSGSYSNLARFGNSSNYIFGWQSRGALDLTQNTWMGDGYTQCSPRWLNHNVAIATMNSKDTLTGEEASSVVGAAEGDLQVNWITYSSTEDHQNVHTAAISSDVALITWETLTNPDCQPVPLGCTGTYAGTSFQLVDNTGAKIGSTVNSTEVFVSGDIANVGTGKVCWPYVSMMWDLSQPLDSATPVTQMSFACASTGGDSTTTASSSAAASVTAASTAAAVAASSSAAVVSSASTAAAVVASSSAAAVSSASTAAAVAASSSVAVVSSAPTVAAVSTSSVPAVVSVSASSDAGAASDIAQASSSSEVIASSTQAAVATSSSSALFHPSTFSRVARPTIAPTVAPTTGDDDECDA
ncbi:hypothetical protein BP6252_01002 [Coleophoma cylindrospora]|uniref:Uncharacterized protein n=1 Tax=Coleophoma cylindrospora TaxID=1849047 RepID=A0A3D8SRM2_9HELO|nr:hypothetical protein BP6252_01002 [Coleophoma cylindrospora]